MSSDSEQETMDFDEEEIESENSENESNDEEEQSDSGHESNDENSASVQVSIEDRVRKEITERYQKRHGKQLFIRFPERLPEDETEFQKKARAVSSLIVDAHKPRQKHARFCLVDFNSQIIRDKAFKDIRKAIKNDASFKGIVALIPRTESKEYVDDLVKKKIESIEAKKAKARLKKAVKRSKSSKEYTSMVVVNKLPGNVSMIEMRKLFPNAIDIQLKSKGGKNNKISTATVTLPSSFDAREAVKKKMSLGGTVLSIRFNVGGMKKKTKEEDTSNTENKDKSDEVQEKKTVKSTTKKKNNDDDDQTGNSDQTSKAKVLKTTKRKENNKNDHTIKMKDLKAKKRKLTKT